jgi:hypothetical protein
MHAQEHPLMLLVGQLLLCLQQWDRSLVTEVAALNAKLAVALAVPTVSPLTPTGEKLISNVVGRAVDLGLAPADALAGTGFGLSLLASDAYTGARRTDSRQARTAQTQTLTAAYDRDDSDDAQSQHKGYHKGQGKRCHRRQGKGQGKGYRTV